MENNMTTGNPGKLIVRFTLPVFIGNVFQQFYSMVDAVIVGKFVGTKALAGVGATGTINFLIIGFLLGLTAGFTVLTAQKYGAGDLEAMRKTVASAAILSLVVSVVMTAASVIFMKNLLRLMNTPEDIFDYAYEYIVIICAGIFAQVLYNLLSSVLRALGNSRTVVFSDFSRPFECGSGPGIYCLLPHGTGRGGVCDCDCTRDIRSSMFALHLESSSTASSS